MSPYLILRNFHSILTGERATPLSTFRSQLRVKGRRSNHTDWNSYPGFFRYTRGRFVSNESHEMAMRHAKFDMNALAKCAAESVGSTLAECVRIDKFPDGNFNKTFLFTMQNGTQVVGKVSNPNAGRAQYTTASEVATMDFVSHLRIPCLALS